MSVTFIGYITVILMVFGIISKAENTAAIMGVLAMLVAAAAFSIGSFTINPALFFLPVFVAKAFIVSPSLRLNASGVFLFIFLLYGLFITLFIPLIFEGDIQIVWSARDAVGSKHQRPLAPGSGNITQSLYAFAAFLCFVSTMKIFETKDTKAICRLGFIVTGVSVLISIVDLVTYSAGMGDFLSFIRNGNYSMLTDVKFAGVKRITGSFTEASFFATYSLALFAFNFSLFVKGIHRKTSGFFCLSTLVMIIMSLSTTGYAGLVIYLSWLFASYFLKFLINNELERAFLLGVASVFFVSISAVVLYFVNEHTAVLDGLIFNKMESESGIERSFWNLTAWNSFLDSYSIGIGFGSTRASSFLLVLLSNTGVIGTILYFMFIIKATKTPDETTQNKSIVGSILACREFVIANLIGATLSSTVFDLGLTIYIIAGASAGVLVSIDNQKIKKVLYPNIFGADNDRTPINN